MSAIAFDIGGANIKAAWNRASLQALQVPFELWKNPASLAAVMAAIARQAEPFDRMLLTMTAELCDCFPDKPTGVRRIIEAACEVAGERPVGVWSTLGRFLDPREAIADPLACAAANWHAQATCLAARFPDHHILLVDTGSTTTDIVRLRGGSLEARGLTDMQRLHTGELVYVGGRRTPLMALRTRVFLRDRLFRVMAEYFATIDDARMCLSLVPKDPQDVSTADGRPRTPDFAAARLARMIGADAHDLDPEDIEDLAQQFHDAAVTRIARAVARAVRRDRPDYVLISGSGESLATAAVIAAGPDLEQHRLAQAIGVPASAAACAWALIQLDAG